MTSLSRLNVNNFVSGVKVDEKLFALLKRKILILQLAEIKCFDKKNLDQRSRNGQRWRQHSTKTQPQDAQPQLVSSFL